LIPWWLGVLLVLALSCGDDGRQPDSSAKRPAVDTFTFFDLGRNSQFSETVRERLSQTLGNDAIERRSIIDLTINSPQFMKRHLPEIDDLNRRLNDPPGERVDHNVIKLMYRYARTRNTPFDYIELLFDGSSRHPVLFRIRFRQDEAGTAAALQSKYGAPQTIPWGDEGGQSMVWRKEKDIMALSLVPDQFGHPDYHIAIFFVDNLTAMIARERSERGRGSSTESRVIKDAF
jgi:hypothetical protein